MLKLVAEPVWPSRESLATEVYQLSFARKLRQGLMERFHLQFQGYGLLCKHVFVNHDDDGHGSENIQEGFIFNLGKIVLQSPAQEHGKDPVNLALTKQTKVFVPCKVGKPASNDIAVQVMGALRAVVAAENDVRLANDASIHFEPTLVDFRQEMPKRSFGDLSACTDWRGGGSVRHAQSLPRRRH
jgi:hypothetical protein